MKTIQQKIDEIYNSDDNALIREYIEKIFNEGVSFAEEWIKVTDEMPICYETGNWDGKRSDFVLAKDDDGDWYKARVYEGIMDGNHYADWFSSEDYELVNIIEWKPINRK